MNIPAALARHRERIFSLRDSPKRPRVFAFAALVAAMTFYAFAVLRVDLHQETRLFDLEPHPDAIENFGAAVSLYQKGDYTIRLCGEEFPPRSPFGFSLSVLPAIHFLGVENAVAAPFYTNRVLGFILIIGFFCYFIIQRRPIAGAAAVAVLVTIPAFILFSRYSLGGFLGTSIVCLAFGLCSEGLRRQSLPLLFASSFILGLGICVKIQIVFYSLLVFSPLLLPQHRLWKDRLGIIVVSGLLFLMGSSPTLIYNWIMFGNPLKTGFNFWITDYDSANIMFSLQHIQETLGRLWVEIALTREWAIGMDIFGPGNCFTPALIVLICISLAFYPTDRRRVFLMVAVGCFAVAVMAFRGVTSRHLVSIAILAIAPICAVVERFFERGIKGKSVILRFLFPPILVATLLGWPSQARSKGKLTTFESLELLKMTHIEDTPHRYDVVSAFRNRFDDGDALVVSPIDPAYVNNMLLSTSICVPQGWDHGYGFGENFAFGKEDADAAILAARANEQRIFYLVSRRIDTTEISSIVLTPNGRQWRELPVPATRGSIYEMVEQTLEGTDVP